MVGSTTSNVFDLLLILVGSLVAVSLITYLWRFVRPAIQQGFATAQNTVNLVRGPFDRGSVRVSDGMGKLKEHLTREGKWPMVAVVLGVIVLAPIEALVLFNDVRAVTAYFERVAPEVDPIPLIGDVSAGFLRALMFAAAAFLVGYLLEAAFDLVPVPLVHHSSEANQRRAKTILVVVAAVLWFGLATTTVDVAILSYQTYGEGSCAAQAESSTVPTDTPAVVVSGNTVSSSTNVAESGAQRADDVQRCMAAWNADQRGRWVFVALAELALHLGMLFAWIVFAAVGLVCLIVMVVLGLAPLGAIRGVLAVLSFLIGAIWVIVGLIIDGIEWVGGLLIRALRHLGLPLPPPNRPPDDQPPAGGETPEAVEVPEQPTSTENGPNGQAPESAAGEPASQATERNADAPPASERMSGSSSAASAGNTAAHEPTGPTAAVQPDREPATAGTAAGGGRRPTRPSDPSWDL